MMRRQTLNFVLACCVAASAGSAQMAASAAAAVAAPSSAPADAVAPPSSLAAATHPTTMPLERQAMEALVRHALDIAQGNVLRAAAGFSAPAPLEQQYVQASGELTEATLQVRLAATKAFGPDGFSAVGFSELMEKDVAALQHAKVKVVDPLTVHIWLGSAPVVMVLRDGHWVIDVGRTYARSLPQRIMRTRAQASAYRLLAQRIEQGKYKLATDARVDGKELVAEAMRAARQRMMAATQPSATAPSTQSQLTTKP